MSRETLTFSKGWLEWLFSEYRKMEFDMANDFGTADVLSRREAAAFLGVCTTTLDRLDIQRIRVRHRVMFKREVLKKWIDDHSENKKRGKA